MGNLGILDSFIAARVAGQIICDAIFPFNVENAVHGRTAKIAIHDHHVSFILGEGDGKVCNDSRFSLLGPRAGYQEGHMFFSEKGIMKIRS